MNGAPLGITPPLPGRLPATPPLRGRLPVTPPLPGLLPATPPVPPQRHALSTLSEEHVA